MRKTTALRRRIAEVLEDAESKRRRRRRRSVNAVMRSKRAVEGNQFDSECLRSQNSISDLGSKGDTEVGKNITKCIFRPPSALH